MGGAIGRGKWVLYLKAVGSIVFMAGILALIGHALAGPIGLLSVLGGALLIFTIVSRRESRFQGAPDGSVPVRREDAPEACEIVQSLAERALIEATPRLILLSEPLVNAATLPDGRQPLILITPILASQLSAREFEGIIAHEISHIRYNHLVFFRIAEITRTATVVITRIGWVLLLLYWPLVVFLNMQPPYLAILLVLTAPVVSVLLQLSLSRSLEFSADLGAVELTGDPDGLAEALKKVDDIRTGLVRQFFPLSRTPRTPSIFRTHPSIRRRIERLQR